MSTRITPQQLTKLENLPESEHPGKQIVIYICPTKHCPNFYAAPSFRPDRSDIESMQYHRSQNDGRQVSSHPRVECPDCRARENIHVNRVPYVVTEIVPLDKMLEAASKAAKREEVANAESG